jgi:hypothetical protein
VATKRQIESLKRRYGLQLLRTPGINGVGVGRGDADDDYVLDVYVTDNSAATRTLVKKVVGPDQPLRLLKSGRFRPH